MKQENNFQHDVKQSIEASIVVKQELLRSEDVLLAIAKTSEIPDRCAPER